MEEGALGIRASSVKEAMAPPPLHRIAVAKIDQLPIGLVLVLRYASTIGVTFDAALLQELVELEGMATPELLQQQLTTLRNFQLITPVGDSSHAPSSSMSVGEQEMLLGMWQVKQSLQENAWLPRHHRAGREGYLRPPRQHRVPVL